MLALTLVLTWATGEAQADARLSFSPATVTAAGSFTLDEVAEDAVGVHLAALTGEFDPGLLRVAGVEEGTFLVQAGATLFYWELTAPGRVRVIVSLREGGATVSGSGLVASLRFDLLGAADRTLITYDPGASKLVSAAGEDLPIASYGAAEVQGLPVPLLNVPGALALLLGLTLSGRRGREYRDLTPGRESAAQARPSGAR